MKLPAELSASIRAGATLFAMMGDQSRSKRGDMELKAFPPEDSGGDGERRAYHLAGAPLHRRGPGAQPVDGSPGPAGKHFSRHIDYLPLARNREPNLPINHFVVLYTDAHDRNWKGNLPTRELIAERRGWAKGRPVRVVDGRKLGPIERFAALARRGIIRCNPFSHSDA